MRDCTKACDLKMKTLPALEILLGKSIKKRDVLKTALTQTQTKLDAAVEALDKLACLGNGELYGNSEGNRIAQKILKEIE